MSRGLSTAQRSAAAAPVVRPVMLVRLDFANQPVLAHTGLGDLVCNGETYKGVGNLGGIGAIKEGTQARSYGAQFTLSGIDPALVATVQVEHYRGRDVRVFQGLLDANYQLIGTPVQEWRGRMDYCDIQLGATASITMNAESRLADCDRARERRYTHEDQQDLYPGDQAFEFVAAMVNKDIVWGKS